MSNFLLADLLGKLRHSFFRHRSFGQDSGESVAVIAPETSPQAYSAPEYRFR